MSAHLRCFGARRGGKRMSCGNDWLRDAWKSQATGTTTWDFAAPNRLTRGRKVEAAAAGLEPSASHARLLRCVSLGRFNLARDRNDDLSFFPIQLDCKALSTVVFPKVLVYISPSCDTSIDSWQQL